MVGVCKSHLKKTPHLTVFLGAGVALVVLLRGAQSQSVCVVKYQKPAADTEALPSNAETVWEAVKHQVLYQSPAVCNDTILCSSEHARTTMSLRHTETPWSAKNRSTWHIARETKWPSVKTGQRQKARHEKRLKRRENSAIQVYVEDFAQEQIRTCSWPNFSKSESQKINFSHKSPQKMFIAYIISSQENVQVLHINIWTDYENLM